MDIKTPLRNVYLVGAGGIGGWLAQAMSMLVPPSVTLTVIDGDAFEDHNLNRQLCGPKDVGDNKAKVIGDLINNSRCRVAVLPEYLTSRTRLRMNSLILGAVDNHAARLSMLNLADKYECPAIIAGNEYYDAEAYYYVPEWAGTPLDPRVYYPRLLTDQEGDPLHPSCTGEEQESHPQLLTANFGAAYFVSKLYEFWYLGKDDLGFPEDTMDHWPVHFMCNANKIFTLTIGDKNAA